MCHVLDSCPGCCGSLCVVLYKKNKLLHILDQNEDKKSCWTVNQNTKEYHQTTNMETVSLKYQKNTRLEKGAYSCDPASV